MKVAVYGFGNQELYVNRIKLQEVFGGEPPFGGSAMAIQFAQAGYDTWLAEPFIDKIPAEYVKKVEDAGVRITKDDVEAAKDADVAVFFTPFGPRTVEIAKRILPHLAENAVIGTTCTMPPTVLYDILDMGNKYAGEWAKRADVGFSTMHPAGVPGTVRHKHYIISTTTTTGRDYATEEQVKRLVELSEASGKKAYIVPADLAPLLGDMGSLITAVALCAVIDYYKIAREFLGAPEEMIKQQIVMTLQGMGSLMTTSGFYGLIKALNPEVLRSSAYSMLLFEEKQKELAVALEKLNNLDAETLEKAKQAEVKPTVFVPVQRFVQDLRRIVGDRVAESLMKKARRNFFIYW